MGRVAVQVAAALVASLSWGCRPPPERTPEGTLSLLRDALATRNPPIDHVADVRLGVEAEVLAQFVEIDTNLGVPLTNEALARTLENRRARMDTTVFFAGMLPLLGHGHCEKIGDSPLPEPLRRSPEPRTGWPSAARALQISVARRLANTTAGDYRCDGGPSFGAAFAHTYPDDGSLRVIYVGPASRP